jgi:NAD-dependent SIR2 family protein deacetylase
MGSRAGGRVIVVIAGAGASTAVSPTDYPTTKEFFAKLPDTITGNPLFGLILARLRQTDPDRIVDIEEALWSLGEILRVIHTVTDPTTDVGFLLSENRLNGPLNSQIDLRGPLGVLTNVAQRGEALQSQINQLVYSLYRKLPDENNLADNWLQLLPALRSRTDRLEVFTTNYDRVIETAVQISQVPLQTGRNSRIDTSVDIEWWKADIPAYEIRLKGGALGLVTKLHGSIDWTRDDGEVRWGNPSFRGRDADHIILYPGFKGEPADEPFTWFHSHLERSIASANALIVIGFAFRDEAIVRAIRTYKPTACPLVVLDPADRIAGLARPITNSAHIQLPFSKLGLERVFATVDPQLAHQGGPLVKPKGLAEES